jgi:hypothetical protein
VLSTASLTEERITTAHRAKLLYVYVRQSSPGQVRHHRESTELQYRLVERAVYLAGHVNVSTLLTTTWVSQVRQARTDMDFSG